MPCKQNSSAIDVAKDQLHKISKKDFVFVDYVEIQNGMSKWVRMPMMKWKQAEKHLHQMNFWSIVYNKNRGIQLIYRDISIAAEKSLDELVYENLENPITKREKKFGSMYQSERDRYLNSGEYTDFYGDQTL